MLSQGWIPGSILGATSINGNTEANFSYMRIKRNEGNRGLGSSHQSQYDESHCLDAFQEVLGRLNGRPEVKCAAATVKSRDLKTVNYVESRWRVLKFVSGGLLAGNKSNDVVKLSPKTLSSSVTEVVTTSDVLANEQVDAGINKIHQRISTVSESPGPCESQEPHDNDVLKYAHLAASESRGKRRESEAREQKKSRKRKRTVNNPADFEELQQSLPEEALTKPPAPAVEVQAPAVVRSSLSSRHAVRIRNIRHKKMVMKDMRALNEVCLSHISH